MSGDKPVVVVGLAGGIASGKSLVASMMGKLGARVLDADRINHEVLKQPRIVEKIVRHWGNEVLDERGQVDRTKLAERIFGDPDEVRALESIVHPLVRADRAEFDRTHPEAIGVFDIPLLYETGSETEFDAVACVTIPEDIQRERVLARGTMSAEELDRILARQMPNAEKCARADFVITTDTLDHARAQVQAVLKEIERRIDA